jgi:predicted amidohydrolase YtcJ
MFFSKDDHLVWANSLALKKAGIDGNTPDPDGGRIIRDDSGEPTGILAENAASLVYSKCSRPAMSTSLRLIEEGIAECHRKGVTAVGNFDGIANFELLQQYHSKKYLKIRIRQFVPVGFLDELLALGIRTNFGGRYLKISGVKLFADGALGSQTALMYEPYAGSKDNLGVEVLTESDMADRIKAAASGGIACAVHAIGDKANHQVLNAFEKLPRRLRILRNRIEHVQLIRPVDVPRFAQLGVIASVQPSHCSSDIDMVRRLWGRRSKNAYVFRSIIDSGAALAFGSDAPIEPIDPIAGMYSATTRKSNDGRSRFHPEQRLSIGEAVAGFTSGAAFATCDEGLFGTISPGKSADIVVMDRDPYRIGLDNLRELQVTATFFEGECVYGWEDINS